jgi:phage/plasmid-associated DNA primase
MSTEFETFLCQVIPNPQARERVLDLLSQILKGTRKEQKMYVFQGTGGNGKTIFLNLIQMLLKDQSVVISDSLLYDDCSERDLACLIGNKLVMVHQTQHTCISPRIKSMLSGPTTVETVDGIRMIDPCFDIIVCTNLAFSDDRRIEIIPFGNVFARTPNQTQLQSDPHIESKFEQWVPIFKSMLLNR